METLSFTEALFKSLKNKDIEVYLGDSGVTRIYSQDQVTMKEVIRGKFVSCIGELMVLETLDGANTKVYVNGWNIKAAVELRGKSITDIYTPEHTKVMK